MFAVCGGLGLYRMLRFRLERWLNTPLEDVIQCYCKVIDGCSENNKEYSIVCYCSLTSGWVNKRSQALLFLVEQ